MNCDGGNCDLTLIPDRSTTLIPITDVSTIFFGSLMDIFHNRLHCNATVSCLELLKMCLQNMIYSKVLSSTFKHFRMFRMIFTLVFLFHAGNIQQNQNIQKFEKYIYASTTCINDPHLVKQRLKHKTLMLP